MSKAKQILLQLPTLDKPDLMQIKARVDVLLALQGVDRAASDDDWLARGMCYALYEKGLTRSVTISRPEKGFAVAALAMSEFLLNKIGGDGLKSVEKVALGRIAGAALRDYISKWATPTIALMQRQTEKVPAALDASFPGYLATGMLRILLREKESAR